MPPVGDLKLDRNPDHTLRCDDSKKVITGKTPFVRLSSLEYNNTLRDLLSPLDMKSVAQLQPDTLRPGFAPDNALAAGNDVVEAQSSGAKSLGDLVAGGLGKLGIDGCPPANSGAEMDCFNRFLDKFVARVYRRPLGDDERQALVTLYSNVRKQADFTQSISTVVEGVLQTPQFLYRVEIGENPKDGQSKLTGYEMASRLSYLLWKTMPDGNLIDAAAKGDLDNTSGLASQVKRMLTDGRARGMSNDFVDAWLNLDLRMARAAASAKDKATFPSYTDEASQSLVRGLGLFIQDSLMGDKGGYRKLFTSNKGWVNGSTSAIYGVEASGTDLKEVELDGNRRSGIMTQPAMMAALANPQKHAPVRRGTMVLSDILCQSPPPPPNGMVPSQPAPDTSVKRTTRERLIVEHHGQGPTCKSCHQVIDGVGFAFEHYDAIGRWQDKEDTMNVDASSVISGSYDADGSFDGAVPMMKKLAQSEQVAQCYVETFYRYALARAPSDDDGCNIAYLTDRVIHSDADLAALIEGVASTPAFRYRSTFSR